MPKTISDALKAHLASEVTTICTCWEIDRRDGTVFYFTDHDADISFDSGSGAHAYVSAVGYTRTAMSSSADLSVDNLDVTGIFDDASITNDDLQSGLFDGAEVRMFLVNWADLTMGMLKLRRGDLGEVNGTPSGVFQSELNGLVSRLNHVVGDVYQATCRVDLGSSGLGQCNKDLSDFTKTATVTSVTDARTFVISVTEPRAINGWFDQGVVTFTSGANNGRSSEIKSWTQSTSSLVMFLPFIKPVQVGDTLSIYPGCDKSLLSVNGCKIKFDNVVNRQAEDFVPGMLVLLRGVTT